MDVKFLVIVTSLVSSGLCQNKTEGDVMKDFLTNYGEKSRPMSPDGDVTKPTFVHFEYYPVKLLYLNQIQQELAVAAVLLMIWEDRARLTWNASDYDNISSINVPLKSIWYPTVGHLRSTNGNYKLGETGDGYVIVRGENGGVTWLSGDTYKSSCELDVTYFPYDVQKCKQIFTPWPDSSKIALSNVYLQMTSKDRLEYYEPNSEWHVKDVSVETWNDYTYMPRNEIRATLTLSRKSRYYTQNVLIPSTMLAVLIFFVFLLPPDAGEKVSFGITVLLTFSVFQLMISNSLPRTSDSYPLLGTAVLFLEVMAATSVLVSVVVLNVHHLGAINGKMSGVTRFIIFSVLARVSCLHNLASKQGKVHPTEASTEKPEDEILQYIKKIDKQIPDSDPNPTQQKLLHEVKQIADKIKQDEEQEEIKMEWRLAALIIDRFLMIVCAIVIVVTVTAIAVPMGTHMASQN